MIQPDQYSDRRAEPRVACDDRGALLFLSSNEIVSCPHPRPVGFRRAGGLRQDQRPAGGNLDDRPGTSTWCGGARRHGRRSTAWA
ncbi:MAG: hypothetical protein WDN06_11440 [Asticcacaulis sp.]